MTKLMLLLFVDALAALGYYCLQESLVLIAGLAAVQVYVVSRIIVLVRKQPAVRVPVTALVPSLHTSTSPLTAAAPGTCPIFLLYTVIEHLRIKCKPAPTSFPQLTHNCMTTVTLLGHLFVTCAYTNCKKIVTLLGHCPKQIAI